jgi:hypothetical protein
MPGKFGKLSRCNLEIIYNSATMVVIYADYKLLVVE